MNCHAIALELEPWILEVNFGQLFYCQVCLRGVNLKFDSRIELFLDMFDISSKNQVRLITLMAEGKVLVSYKVIRHQLIKNAPLAAVRRLQNVSQVSITVHSIAPSLARWFINALEIQMQGLPSDLELVHVEVERLRQHHGSVRIF